MTNDVVRTESGVQLIRIPDYDLLNIEELFHSLEAYKDLKVAELIHWNSTNVYMIECKSSFPKISKKNNRSKKDKKALQDLAQGMGYVLEEEGYDVLNKFITSVSIIQKNQIKNLIKYAQKELENGLFESLVKNHECLNKSGIGEKAEIKLVHIINPGKLDTENEVNFERAIVEFESMMKIWHKQKIAPLYPNSKLLVISSKLAQQKKLCRLE